MDRISDSGSDDGGSNPFGRTYFYIKFKILSYKRVVIILLI